jgi:AraC-like DNA-binding protein
MDQPIPIAPSMDEKALLAPALRSERLADLRDRVQQVTVVHEIGVRKGRPNGTVAVANLAALNLVIVRYGAQVTVDAFPTRTRFALTIPLGPMRVFAPGVDGQVLTSGFVLAADGHTIMQPDPHAGALVVCTGMSRVEDHLETLLGRPAGTALRFLPPGTGPAVAPVALVDAAWRTACRLLAESPMSLAPVTVRALEEQLLTAVLLGLPHTATTELCRGPDEIPADAVARAREWMEMHHAEPLTVADVARVAGLGIRQLQELFRRQLGTTPTAVLRDIRLGQARRALRRADATGPGAVAAVAYSSGFTHLSRFARDYRARFGELPSETARGPRMH